MSTLAIAGLLAVAALAGGVVGIALGCCCIGLLALVLFILGACIVAGQADRDLDDDL